MSDQDQIMLSILESQKDEHLRWFTVEELEDQKLTLSINNFERQNSDESDKNSEQKFAEEQKVQFSLRFD